MSLVPCIEFETLETGTGMDYVWSFFVPLDMNVIAAPAVFPLIPMRPRTR